MHDPLDLSEGEDLGLLLGLLGRNLHMLKLRLILRLWLHLILIGLILLILQLLLILLILLILLLWLLWLLLLWLLLLWLLLLWLLVLLQPLGR